MASGADTARETIKSAGWVGILTSCVAPGTALTPNKIPRALLALIGRATRSVFEKNRFICWASTLGTAFGNAKRRGILASGVARRSALVPLQVMWALVLCITLVCSPTGAVAKEHRHVRRTKTPFFAPLGTDARVRIVAGRDTPTSARFVYHWRGTGASLGIIDQEAFGRIDVGDLT